MENHESSQNEGGDNNEHPVKKGRGLARKTPAWGKTKLNIQVNDKGQPCGGDYKALASQIGFIMKNGHLFPLTETWKEMDLVAIESAWKEIEDNTNLPPHSKRVCIDSMSRSWRDWKGRVKKAGYYPYNTDIERLENCPEGVVAEQWSQLIDMWNLEESKKVAKTNQENAKKQEFWQSTGKKPIPVLKQQLADEGKMTDRLSVFMASRAESKREATKKIIEKLNEVVADMPEELQKDPAAREERFVDIFGKDQHGRMRCMGHSVTPTMIYGRRGAATSAESVTNVRAEFEEKMELQKQEMERRMQAEREAYKIEMEARIQAEREASKIEMEEFKKEILSQLQSQSRS